MILISLLATAGAWWWLSQQSEVAGKFGPRIRLMVKCLLIGLAVYFTLLLLAIIVLMVSPH